MSEEAAGHSHRLAWAHRRVVEDVAVALGLGGPGGMVGQVKRHGGVCLHSGPTPCPGVGHGARRQGGERLFGGETGAGGTQSLHAAPGRQPSRGGSCPLPRALPERSALALLFPSSLERQRFFQKVLDSALLL